MGNRKAAAEWLILAQHDFKAAKILLLNDHYTDSIGSLIQQSLEKSFKSLMAFDNVKVNKTHDLVELSLHITNYMKFEENEIDLIDTVSSYYIKNRYPSNYHYLPDKNEITEALDFVEEIIKNICSLTDIEKLI